MGLAAQQPAGCILVTSKARHLQELLRSSLGLMMKSFSLKKALLFLVII
jgi:hypothetical protein